VEIDAATFESNGTAPREDASVASRQDLDAARTAADLGRVADTFEVQVINTDAGPTLVAAIELVSPSNKDRPDTRRAFAVKCASYLIQGISLIVVDVVSNRHANLHDELVRLLADGDAFLFPATPFLYAAAYRPIRRGQQDQHDVWLNALAVGQPLPELPLALNGELCVPIDLEGTYAEACRKLRLPG